MMRKFTIIFLLVLVGLGGLLLYRINGKVLAERVSPSGYAIIRVRALQPMPASINGLLGLDETIYRCEYYAYQSWPLTSCQSYSGESFFPNNIRIEWKTESKATVSLDKFVSFECVDGQWRRISP